MSSVALWRPFCRPVGGHHWVPSFLSGPIIDDGCSGIELSGLVLTTPHSVVPLTIHLLLPHWTGISPIGPNVPFLYTSIVLDKTGQLRHRSLLISSHKRAASGQESIVYWPFALFSPFRGAVLLLSLSRIPLLLFRSTVYAPLYILQLTSHKLQMTQNLHRIQP